MTISIPSYPTKDRLSDSALTLLTVARTAELPGVHRSTVYDLINSGALAWVSVGRHKRIARAALATYIERHTQRGGTPDGTLGQ